MEKMDHLVSKVTQESQEKMELPDHLDRKAHQEPEEYAGLMERRALLEPLELTDRKVKRGSRVEKVLKDLLGLKEKQERRASLASKGTEVNEDHKEIRVNKDLLDALAGKDPLDYWECKAKWAVKATKENQEN